MEFASQRYERHAPFITEQEKLHNGRVLLAGCGAGSSLAPRLARLGIGTSGLITLADPDIVDISNLNRQEFNENNIGENKAIALKERISAINTDVNVEAVPEGITIANVHELVSNADVVVDMIDIAVPEVMSALHEEAKSQGKPVITGFDIGEGIISYVFDYRNDSNMTLNRFIGLPENTTSEEIAKIPTFPLAMQFIMGPTNGVFDSTQSAIRYYNSLMEIHGEELYSFLPQEAKEILPKILSGELDFIPQTDSAASLLGATHEVLVKELLLGHQVKKAPDSIRLNLLELVSA